MTLACRRHFYLSPLNRLSSPTDTSNRLRGTMRAGFLSLFCVFGAGMESSVEPYSPTGHGEGRGVYGFALTLPQKSPPWNCWSALSPLRTTAGCPLGSVVESGQVLEASMP